MELTIGADANIIRKFDVFRKKRNISDYERAETVSDLETKEMRKLAVSLRKTVEAWIKKNHPEYAP